MTIQELFKKINDFLLAQTGITHTLFDHLRSDKKESLKSVFFNPCHTRSEFFYKSASVVTAPIGLSLIAIELAVNTLYLGLKSVLDLAKCDPHTAKVHIIDAVIHCVFSFVAVMAAVLSPVINLVDLIGSGITTLRQNNENPLKGAASCN